jgi:hypothetical protein
MTADNKKPFDHESVVRNFDHAGYGASFRQVAIMMGFDGPLPLTLAYPTREILGEYWLESVMPNEPDAGDASLHGAFTGLLLPVLRSMGDYPDFSRAWIAAVATKAPFHLAELTHLRDAASEYFVAWLSANTRSVSLPPGLALDDVCTEMADGFCALSLIVIGHWAYDHSSGASESVQITNAFGYLLDALFMRRADLGDAGALVHLLRVASPLHGRLVEPLLALVAKPDRVARLLDPASLVEFARTLRPAQAARR